MTPKEKEHVASVAKALGLPQSVVKTIEFIEVAEEELARAGLSKRCGAFRLLLPPRAMTLLAERVYRHHCRELIGRIKTKKPHEIRAGELELATEAEVLTNMMSASLIAPPNQQWAALHELLFVRVMGVSVDGEPTREPWPKASEELLGELRKRCRSSGRGA